MRSLNIYIITALLFVILIFLVYQYIFSIYEVIYSVEPKELFPDNKSTVTITAVPLNAFGYKAPFRSTPAHFEIVEGSNLVEITAKDENNGTLVLKAKDKPGIVVVHVKAEKSLLPSPLKIPVQPNVAVNMN
jgi:hypothetical protein